jgi:cytidine deaminase
MNRPLDLDGLLDRARGAAASAYAPYSNFHVGAVVIAADGREFTGVNVENSAYGATICAEANAISSAAAAGVRSIDTVVVACPDADECYPCGNCRQVMREFGVQRVVVQNPDGGFREHSLQEILPHAFGPDQLGTT